MKEHFARVRPIVGEELRHKRVAVFGLPAAAPLVKYLAACGVGAWLWDDPGVEAMTGLRASLQAQHGPALPLDTLVAPRSTWLEAACRLELDLAIVVGNESSAQAMAAAQTPVLLVEPPTCTHPCRTTVILPGDEFPGVLANAASQEIDAWSWITSAPLCAGLARAILLRRTPFCRTDLLKLWNGGARTFVFGAADDPLQAACYHSGKAPAATVREIFHTPVMQRGVLLIAGLGSLGSMAALHLAPYVGRMLVVDPDWVEIHNPVRQAYPLHTVGQRKAQALQNLLLQASVKDVIGFTNELQDEDTVQRLVARYSVTAALVATGTTADFAIARGLRNCNVPHVVGRCYPRARYWEAILVDRQNGPAFGEMRNQARPRPVAPLTPEQMAAYSDGGALEAEPATLIESGWAAAWLARLTAQFLAPLGLRERWFLELLAAEQTCLVGGIGIESTPEGPAYGITLPGQIHAWSSTQIRSQVHDRG